MEFWIPYTVGIVDGFYNYALLYGLSYMHTNLIPRRATKGSKSCSHCKKACHLRGIDAVFSIQKNPYIADECLLVCYCDKVV